MGVTCAVNTEASSVVDGFSASDVNNGVLVGTVGLTDEITGKVVGKMVEDGVMITLDSPTASTAGKIAQCVIANYSQASYSVLMVSYMT